MIASLSKHFGLSRWNAFRLAYYYTTTYHIPSALKLLQNPKTPKTELKFRTDRRYVRIGDNFDRVMAQLSPRLLEELDKATTTTEQYNIVSSWFFFGRYAAFLFLEVWSKLDSKPVIDNLVLKFDPKENYTKGAQVVTKSKKQADLIKFVENVKRDTGDNVFSIETSLCAVEKLRKGTRWNGFYTERLLNDIRESEWENTIISLL